MTVLVTCYGCACNNNKANRSPLRLVISEADFEKVKQKRIEALNKKLLIKSKDDYVSGSLQVNGEIIKVKTRLKGDHPDHFEGNRWSFRIVGENEKIFNHKKISVQGVHTRAYITEWIFHKLLNEEGLIYLQYKFLPFSVNDTLEGIYAIESHFDNHLLELSNREYGPIFKFNEDDFWDYSKFSGKKNRDDLLMINSKIDLTNKKWGKKNKEIVHVAKSLLDSFRTGKIPCKKVFDLEKWAKFIAINELMASDHALRWHNLRFYFNPNTKKFEPIGFDCTSWMKKTKSIYFNGENIELFHSLMLKDTQYVNLINEELKRVSNRMYMYDFFKNYKKEIKENESLIVEEKENYKFWKSSFYESQKRIINNLNLH
tara:strand:- start:20041 stop:21156 length:1116 start_codon:yes stop_codon:yes gene_type:complete